MEKLRVNTSQNVHFNIVTASIVDRFLALLIDYILLGFYLTFALASLGEEIMTSFTLQFFFILLPLNLYFLIFEILMNGKTPGKAAMGIRVARLDGTEPSIGNYISRNLLRFIEANPILYISSGTNLGSPEFMSILFLIITPVAVGMMIISKTNQRVGDILAGTTVIRQQKLPRLANLGVIDIPSDYSPVFKEVESIPDEDIRKIINLFNQIRASKNFDHLAYLLKKIKTKYGINSNQDDLELLNTIMRDYTFYYYYRFGLRTKRLD